MPMVNASGTETSAAIAARRRLLGSRPAIISSTAMPLTREIPGSPVTNPPSQ
ncbi:hypothetical protein D3C80_2123010 [compost metagenome]